MDTKGKSGSMLPGNFTFLALALIVFLALPGWGLAAEFTAKMILKDGAKTMPGKICVKGDKMRQEFIDDTGHTVTIVRQDKKVIWVVMLQEQVYVEMPLKKGLPGQFLQIPETCLHKRKVGTEEVNGYQTEKYKVLVRGGRKGALEQTFWVSEKLGLPLKMDCKEKKFSVEYLNIREGQLADKLFEVPRGFKKMSKKTGFM